MTPDANKAIILRLLDAFGSLDLAAMDAVLAVDLAWEIPGDPTQFPLAGPLERSALLERLPVLFPHGITMTAGGMTAEADRVAVEVESRGVMADGFVYGNRYHFVFQVKGDRIVAAREYCDTQRAAGMIPHALAAKS